MDRNWSTLLETLLAGRDLAAADTGWAMHQVMRGEATDAQLAGFLVALRGKGETVGELEGLVRALLDHAVPLDVPGATVDVVGTGGDGARTVNISTMSAIVAAGAGARVVKHGNRASSSASGSADVLEALGVTLRLPPARVAELVDEAGITFCFAPDFHPSMRHASPVRRQLGIPTFFNALGPLTNPARPTAQAVGVADARLLPLIAGVLARRGTSALVFRGDDGLDELSVTGTSTVLSVEGEGSGRNPSTPATSASRSPRSTPCGAPTPRTTRRWPGGCSPAGSWGPYATRCCSRRGPRWPPPSRRAGAGSPSGCGRPSPWRRTPSTRGPRERCWSAGCGPPPDTPEHRSPRRGGERWATRRAGMTAAVRPYRSLGGGRYGRTAGRGQGREPVPVRERARSWPRETGQGLRKPRRPWPAAAPDRGPGGRRPCRRPPCPAAPSAGSRTARER